MEIVQGKSTNKKIVIAQEIAFAKVLSGNNKTLRDRAVKKLKKWLSFRGNGNWAFTEDEFMRIWTGLFYCMWMSDKFLVQEELAENISNLVHCFKKNSENGLLFIKCFNKRLLMEWAGLDQYRIDKFQMLARRFLRQTFRYCKEKDWDQSVLKKLMEIYNSVVFHKDSPLGFVLHFISIYLEELGKVSNGKIKKEKVLTFIEPFVKLISKCKDERVLNEVEDFFTYLMKQTNVGIEAEEQFQAWKKLGFPGKGPNCLKKVKIDNEEDDSDNCSLDSENFEDEENKIWDPRAGSVHVFLPQIPLDIDGILNLFKKYINYKHTNVKGRRKLRLLTQRYNSLKKGKFPEKIEKDAILLENLKKRNQTLKNAKRLLKFSEKIDELPIKTKQFKNLFNQLTAQNEENESFIANVEKNDESKTNEIINGVDNSEIEKEKEIQEKLSPKAGAKVFKKSCVEDNNSKNNVDSKIKVKKKVKKMNGIKKNLREDSGEKENKIKIKTKKDVSKTKLKMNGNDLSLNSKETNKVVESVSKNKNLKRISETPEMKKISPIKKKGVKRKLSNSWIVEELDPNDPNMYKLKTPKLLKIERKIGEISNADNVEKGKLEMTKNTVEENKWKDETPKEFFPVFWAKAIAKVNDNKKENLKILKNSLTNNDRECKSRNLRKISFALDKNMAQENEEYLEEVKNSPRVPFDGSKKPVHSALKSGLSPSPVNPFYRFKKIKF